MSRQNLFSQNAVQTIIDSLDPRKKFLDLAKKNSADSTQNPFIEQDVTQSVAQSVDTSVTQSVDTSVGTSANSPVKRIEERINENFEPAQTTTNKPVDTNVCERKSINICVVVEIILLLLTFIACFYFAKKQIEMSKQACKQNKKIIKLLKTQMALMVKA